MKVFKFRVLLDTEEDVFRDIEVRSDNTFLELHRTIIEAFGFEGGEMASFYESNEDWDKGTEIPLMEMEVGAGTDMASTQFGDRVEGDDVKFVYVYDFLRMWCFYIDLQETKDAAGDKYPSVVLNYGDAPDENSKEIADLRSDAFSAGALGGAEGMEGMGEFDNVSEGMEDMGGESFDNLEGLDEYY